MNKKMKVFLIFIVIAAVASSGIYYYMYNMPKRNVENEKGIEITAAQLVKEYQEDEQAANGKFLDKAIKVTGTIGEVGTNQEGKVTLLISSDDAFTGVFCTLKKDETKVEVKAGETISVKGICSGMLSDVRLSEAVIVQ